MLHHWHQTPFKILPIPRVSNYLPYHSSVVAGLWINYYWWDSLFYSAYCTSNHKSALQLSFPATVFYQNKSCAFVDNASLMDQVHAWLVTATRKSCSLNACCWWRGVTLQFSANFKGVSHVLCTGKCTKTRGGDLLSMLRNKPVSSVQVTLRNNVVVCWSWRQTTTSSN